MDIRTTPPPLSQFGDLSLEFPHPIALNNGIQCYVINGGDEEMNRVGIYLAGGTMMETKPGVSLLTALLLTEGTTKMEASEVAEQFDYYAARKSAYCFENWTAITMTSLNDNFAHTMKLLSDCITQPSFPQQELEMWKRRISSNIAVLQEQVGYLADVEMRKLYYGNESPLGHDITPHEIMSITRQDLIDFQQKYYTTANCRVIISGKITRDVMQSLNESIGTWATHTQPCPPPQWSITPSPLMKSLVDKPGAVQSAVRIRIQAVKRSHPDYLPLRVLIDALGGYFGSRLMANIREDKGYTYGIQAALCGSHHDGYIEIMCECATQHTWNVIKEIKHEMKQLREQLIGDEELYTVKQDLLSALAKTHDTPHNIARYVANTMLVGIYPEYHNKQLACIDTITPAKLRELATNYLCEEKMRVVIAGNKEELGEQ